MSARVRHAFAESAAVLATVVERDAALIERMARLVASTVRRGRTVFFAGNGGSAAEAQHFATELVVRFVRDRGALPAMALTSDVTTLTAAGNDLGFDQIFARSVAALGRRGDLLVALSTSGRSRNILAAVAAARARGMRVIGMTGAAGRAFARRCDLCLVVPSRVTARIQEIHLLAGHLCCEAAEEVALRRKRAPRATGRPRAAKAKGRARG
ncbi:MAG TPA: SIS domain-containing protein [Candidatus Eisenbacteria bacterium]|nr:SIS domain-containing protein [Candidatus Eisenbacteria bacterium]